MKNGKLSGLFAILMSTVFIAVNIILCIYIYENKKETAQNETIEVEENDKIEIYDKYPKKIQLSKETFLYNGLEKKPIVTVMDSEGKKFLQSIIL